MYKVMIQESEYADCRRAVDRAFDVFKINPSGRKVLIKPNVLRSSRNDDGIVTHPAVLRAVVERVEEMCPASLIVGDNPGIQGYGANEESFRSTGLMDAAKGYYRNIGTDSVILDFNPEFLPKVSVSRAVLEADLVISLPKFKTHGLTVMTGCIKNSYGILPGALKATLHKAAGSPRRFHEMVVDVFRLRVPDFFIVDAVIGMEGNGPASPDLRHIGRILASDNGVALDGVIARMMGLDPARLRFLQKARELGLGDFSEDQTEILGRLEVIPDFKLPPLGGEAIAENPVMQEAIGRKSKLRPSADPDVCTGCGSCAKQCPVSALSMSDGLPEVDPEACIACFCCQEMCPEKAMALR
ncbi:MAG: DUF362 domain-containing protein [Syntrophobacteraceae bacterium]|nr:DUF362 domain-containing protein [Desulfobacteraceae bacterium]